MDPAMRSPRRTARAPGRAHRRDEMEEEALPSFFVQLPSERTKELLLPTLRMVVRAYKPPCSEYTLKEPRLFFVSINQESTLHLLVVSSQ